MLFLKTLLAFITHHAALAYGAIFLISLSESLALIGLIVPGTVIMFGIGAAEVVPKRLLGLIIVFMILTAGGWHVANRHEKDLAFYAPRHDVQSMTVQKWIRDGWRQLPAWRIDLAGQMEQPLIIQWPGHYEDIAKYFLAKGWRRPPPLNLKNFLGMFSPDTPIEELPVLPRLHDGRIDTLRLVHQTKGQRWVLRMWSANVKIAGNDTPLFVGTIEVRNRRHMTGLITAARDTGEYDRPLDALEQMLNDRFTMKLVSRTGNEIEVNREDCRLHWRGGVVLVWEKAG